MQVPFEQVLGGGKNIEVLTGVRREQLVHHGRGHIDGNGGLDRVAEIDDRPDTLRAMRIDDDVRSIEVVMQYLLSAPGDQTLHLAKALKRPLQRVPARGLDDAVEQGLKYPQVLHIPAHLAGLCRVGKVGSGQPEVGKQLADLLAPLGVEGGFIQWRTWQKAQKPHLP